MKKAVYLLCDIQEAFRSKIPDFTRFVRVHHRMIRACSVLKIPVIVSEQNPHKLGSTVHELSEVLSGTLENSTIFSKMGFSMLTTETDKMTPFLKECDAIVLGGLESHVCILQTLVDLVRHYEDKKIYLLLDGIASRHPFQSDMLKERLRDAELRKIRVTTSESWLFEWMQTANHPQFREISQIMKEAN